MESLDLKCYWDGINYTIIIDLALFLGLKISKCKAKIEDL
jgi:hypothetical protein